jgi:hypothetical protein
VQSCSGPFLLLKYIVARMAKLADALASGASGREVVQVQVLFRALETKMLPVFWVAFLFPMFPQLG